MDRRSKQRGMTLAMVAISLTALLALASLAIDMGMLYTARTSAQHAADAAALAGAFTYQNPAAAQPAAARTAAENIGDKNPILGKLPTITDADVVVDTVNQRVTVRVPRVGANGIPMFFSSILGRTTGDVMATATAECSKVGAGSRCLKPVYIPNTILSDKLPAAACTAGERLFAPDGSVTAFALSKMGQQYPIRPSNPQQALESSQFYSLDFGAGANTYRCTLGQCLSECDVDTQVVRCGQSYPLKTGDMVGPTRQGVDDLTGPTPDTWVATGQYRHDDGNIYDTSSQLVVAPVWDSCTQVITPGYHGQQVRIIGFVELFIDGMSSGGGGGKVGGGGGGGGGAGGNVLAHFVKPTACSLGGGAGEGNEFGANTGPLGVPIRLVRTPQP